MATKAEQLEKPEEVKIEVTPNCNYNCEFCFTKPYKSKKSLAKEKIYRILDNIVDVGIERVRFTGGEPLMRKDLPDIARHARGLGLYVMLNSNGSLLNREKIEELEESLDNVLISFNSLTREEEQKISNSKDSFKRKLEAIPILREKGIYTRLATILVPENIRRLNKFHSLIKGLNIQEWVLLRPMPVGKNSFSENREIGAAVEKIIKINELNDSDYLIENAIPFCCYEPERVAMAAFGSQNEDGHSKLVVDFSGRIKPSYFSNEILGNALEEGAFIEAWNSQYEKKLRALEFVPKRCKRCKYLERCKSGSRYAALTANGELNSLDPLAKPEKYSEKLFE